MGVLLPTTLAHSQLHQVSDEADVCRQSGTLDHSFQSCPLLSNVQGVKVSWCMAILSNLFVPTSPAGWDLRGFQGFLTVVAFVLLRMVMLLRDLHYDHLDRSEGHRTESLHIQGCSATCRTMTETVPSVHGAELVVQSLGSHSQVSCHLDLGATPSVQATAHQM